jgi:hypothetical protein
VSGDIGVAPGAGTCAGSTGFPTIWERLAVLGIDTAVAIQSTGPLFLGVGILARLWIPEPTWPWSLAVPVAVLLLLLTVGWWKFTTAGLALLQLRLVDSRSLGRPRLWQCLVRALPTTATGLTGAWLTVLLALFGIPDARPAESPLYRRLLGLSAAVLLLLLIPYASMAWGKSRRSLWDRLSRTVVVRAAASAEASPESPGRDGD